MERSPNAPVWVAPPPQPTLSQRSIHVWKADLTIADLSQWLQTLSPDEKERAARFRFDRDRDRFIAARGIVRNILAQYLQQSPAAIPFCYGERGKPAIANSPIPLQFNLSHSQDLLLCAVSQSHRVGIDVEIIREIADLNALSHRFFHASEAAAIQTAEQSSQPTLFLRHWTCKEAVLKAIATGLAELSSVEVAIAATDAVLIRLECDRLPAKAWFLHSFLPAPDAVAALASDCRNPQLAFWQWQNFT